MSKKKKIRKIKKPKSYNIKSKITQAVRRIWYWSPDHKLVKARCKQSKDLYRCERCRALTNKLQIDHVEPVVDPVMGWQGYEVFITRMFPDPSIGLRGLCPTCHTKLTEAQNIVRKENRKK
jgi:hypothetical protein